MSGGTAVEFGVLGPLTILGSDGPVLLGHSREERVLAALLLDANRLVPMSRLVDAVWEDPPPTATKAIRNAVSALRRLLAGDEATIVTHTAGYVLQVGDGQVDAHRFDRQVEAARRLAAAGRRQDAAQELRTALGLWRGPALAGIGGSLVEAAAAGLDERRLTVLEECLAVELTTGRDAELIEELTALVTEHPLRERLRGQLMLALARVGRRTEALMAYRNGRSIMVRELGLEPGPELRRLEQAVLTGEPLPDEPDARGPSRPVPAQLPADVTAFVGRTAQLEQLDAILTAADGRRPGAVVISAIAGTAGVGKTALALHWAHRVRDRFPDGQLHIDLRGYATGPPRRAIDALTTFLQALQVPPDQVPVDVESAAGLYRTLLADRRMLVVLDNAAGPEQVRPLLPGSPGSLVLITSRDRLTGLVARESANLITLDVLTPVEAELLLVEVIGPDRTGAEPGATGELATACARLPLALRIAAASLVSQQHRSIADYLAALRGADRLAALTIEDDDQTAVRAAFDQSYGQLAADAQLMFRRLGLLPGRDAAPAGAAALADLAPLRADRALDRLAAAHLVRRGTGGRVSFHDLLRSYAAELAQAQDAEPDRAAATRRLYDFYLRRVDAAAKLLYPQMLRLADDTGTGTGTEESFADRPAALAWLDAERPNLVAAVLQAAGHGPGRMAVLLADAIRGYFHLRRGWGADWLAVASAGLATATAAGDVRAQAAAQLSLADANQRQSRYSPAIEHYAAALDLNDRAGWLDGRGVVLGNMGLVFVHTGQPGRALEHVGLALEVTRRTGRRVGTAMNLDNQGLAYQELGRLREATGSHRDAVELHREIGTRLGEAIALGSLAEAELGLGELAAAAEHAAAALAIHREIGDRGNETEVLRVLAGINRDEGSLQPALEYARAALALARETGDRRLSAGALNALATIEQRLFRHTDAIVHHRQAADLAHELEARHQEAAALAELAAAHHHLGHAGEATEAAEQALALARPAGFALIAAHALVVLAETRARTGADPRPLAAEALALLADHPTRPDTLRAHRLID